MGRGACANNPVDQTALLHAMGIVRAGGDGWEPFETAWGEERGVCGGVGTMGEFGETGKRKEGEVEEESGRTGSVELSDGMACQR